MGSDPETIRNICNKALMLTIPVYITFCTPNVLEIVGYDRLQKPVLPWAARFLKFSGNPWAPAVCGVLFAVALLRVITVDNSPFIYFAF